VDTTGLENHLASRLSRSLIVYILIIYFLSTQAFDPLLMFSTIQKKIKSTLTKTRTCVLFNVVIGAGDAGRN
jgi:hypothetical protein